MNENNRIIDLKAPRTGYIVKKTLLGFYHVKWHNGVLEKYIRPNLIRKHENFFIYRGSNNGKNDN